jgi:putative ABC transport system ATP-binding protein
MAGGLPDYQTNGLLGYMTNEPFIVCDNLVKIHKVAGLEVVALQGLDLTVAPGELLGIVGPSGSGKSTLMNILGGLDRPSAGRVWVDGQDLLKLSTVGLDHYRSSKMGFVWQQSSRNLIPYLSAIENIEFPLIAAGKPWGKARRRANELLELVELKNRKGAKLAQLSGGEQQRVAIAVALANEPRLLLADEPTGEVDTTTAQQIYRTFQEINHQTGLTTLIVSHDIEIARQVHRVVAIRDGKTATETVRMGKTIPAGSNNGAEEKQATESEHEEEFVELTVLDSAGRLQLPKDYLQHFNIKGRVLVEVTQDGILIRPAPESNQAQTTEALVKTLEQKRKPGWWNRLIPRLSLRKKQ